MRDLLGHSFVPEVAVMPDVSLTRMGMTMDTCADVRRGTSIGSRTGPTARSYLPAVLTSMTKAADPSEEEGNALEWEDIVLA